ncbi:hypothetical protein ACVRQW_004891, partial [Escherichia coli]
NYSFLGYSGTMKVTPDRITDYKAPSAEEAAVASQAAKRPPVVNYPGDGFREMTKAQLSTPRLLAVLGMRTISWTLRK